MFDWKTILLVAVVLLLLYNFYKDKIREKINNKQSSDDRLKLENAVRDIEDQDIFDQWQEFIQSKTEDQAQEEVKNLLELLVKKIAY